MWHPILWISPGIELISLVGFIELTGNVVVVIGGDCELFAGAHPGTKIVGLLITPFGQVGLAQVGVGRSQSGVGKRKVGVQFDRAFKIGNR